MPVDNKIYDKKFFDNTFKFEADSARDFTSILIKYFQPKSVIDIGCGVGIYLAEFKKNNIKILGYDGSPAAIKGSLVGKKIKLYDLCKPLKLKLKFDLCLCLEVAEHLKKKYAKTLVNSLSELSNIIIFTAATPGQGPKSIGHINEQPHKYWQKLFEEKNFKLNKKLTEKIRKEMINKKVVWWITKNLMIYEK
ncbi:MAG: methyltransferase domain-containing protein [Patescibacteria group bacterium]|jgi:2-polyprenyl-3-methyl-5-hydroxy-6-metoxy-1,4-benzoquinol methylase